MSIGSEKDLIALKKIGEIVANCLQFMKSKARVGMTTLELDAIGRKFLEDMGARSAPELVYNFPGATCISVNENVAHGIPNETILQDGDLINIDVSAELDGYYADTGKSFCLAGASEDKIRVCQAAELALEKALSLISVGVSHRKLGALIEKTARTHKCSVIENLCGHGVGRKLHEEPKYILSFDNGRDKRKFKKDLVVAIEPFVSTGASMVQDQGDGWTLCTPGHFSAQSEHSIVITDAKPIILTEPTINVA